MTAEAFKPWLWACKNTGLLRFDAAAAKGLGVHVNTVVKYKQSGAPVMVALACAALYRRIEPWR